MSPRLDLLRWHLRRERGRIAILAIAAGVFIGLIAALSDTLKPAEIQELSGKLPAGVTALMGIKAGQLFTQEVWMALAHNHPLWLLLTLTFPISAGLRGIAGGIADGTLEPVLARPFSRSTYFASLALALLLGSLIIALASGAAAFAAARLLFPPEAMRLGLLLQLALSAWALALAVAGLTLACSAAPLRGRSGSWAIGLVLAAYFIRYLTSIWPACAAAAPLSLFRYHTTQDILEHGLNPGRIAVLLGFALLSAALGHEAFRRRELAF